MNKDGSILLVAGNPNNERKGWVVQDQQFRTGDSAGTYQNQVGNFSRLVRKYGKGDEGFQEFVFKLWPETGRTRIVEDMESWFNDGVAKATGNRTSEPVNHTNSAPAITAEENAEIVNLINTATSFKPANLIIPDVKWKYLVRSVLRGKNLMITGPAGCGKTLAVRSVADAMNRPFYYFNLGATQDPRSTLIGNTHYKQGEGTFFSDSLFVKAIQTENSVILMDELSRAHPEAWNILMTVLDDGQRYLRVDEDPDSPTIEVAKGVSFLATANIGMEYTSTRVIDRAIADRFQILEMSLLAEAELVSLIRMTYTDLPVDKAELLAKIYMAIRSEIESGSGKITTGLSTRTLLATAGLMVDEFTLSDAAEVCIFPYFSNDGGVESERTYVRQLMQRFIPSDGDDENGDLFAADDAQQAQTGQF